LTEKTPVATPNGIGLVKSNSIQSRALASFRWYLPKYLNRNENTASSMNVFHECRENATEAWFATPSSMHAKFHAKIRTIDIPTIKELIR
jgi:hypothetical protein